MLLWPLRVISCLFLACMMSDQRRFYTMIIIVFTLNFDLVLVPLESSFSILSFGFLSIFEMV